MSLHKFLNPDLRQRDIATELEMRDQAVATVAASQQTTDCNFTSIERAIQAAIQEISTEHTQHLPSLEEIVITYSEDPLFISAINEPEMLSRTLEMIASNRMIAAGIVPSSFTETGACVKCGVVLLETKAEGLLYGCPWCHTS